jgi:hypothetical protein
MAIYSARAVSLVLCSLAMFSLRCYSADLVFIGSSGAPSNEQLELAIASRFYGLNVRVLAPDDQLAVKRAVQEKTTVGVAISATALSRVKEEPLLRALNGRSGGSVPVLVLGLAPETDPNLLRAWAGGASIACRRAEAAHAFRYVVNSLEGITGALSGATLPFAGHDAAYLGLPENEKHKVQQITELQEGDRVFPVFVETSVDQVKVFLLSTVGASSEAAEELNSRQLMGAFSEIAPVMLFAKYCAGERGWHTVHPYANFTIDDPWLREPYGFLTYKGLFAEMEKHNFHSTIAFIPWNYDRSEPQVVALIRKHPERFSICIHGDNHDHKEFSDYRSKPLALQIKDLHQSLARMERFRELTGIPYDKVMIFPHSIGPEKTLAALKDTNYLATVNSTNVPMDAARPQDLLFDLRATTLSFADFPSVRRYSVEGLLPTGLAAVNLFLGNPLLFYCHQEFFSSGIGAFDKEADAVNRIQPDIRWRSLGEIIRRLYLVKRRDDDDFDVLSFAGTTTLENVSTRDALFHVRKEESDRPAEVTVDGEAWSYSLHDGYLEMQIPVRAGTARNLSITYRDPEELQAVGIEKGSFRVYCLRMASDFRDITLSRFAAGLAFIRFYQEHGEPLALMLVCASAVGMCLLVGVWRMRVKLKSQDRRAATAVVTSSVIRRMS